MVDRKRIRFLAAEHIRELGLTEPPFDHEASLRARGLALLTHPLETILLDSNLPEEVQEKIDGFIDLQGRVICLKAGLHPHQYRFGLRHEVAHDVIPWQREILYYCAIFSLPEELQRAFELEANVFAAECAFFADQFIERIISYPRDLRSAIILAGEYAASYESTLRHYVGSYPGNCLLLVSKKLTVEGETAAFETVQYIRSPEATMSIRPRLRFDWSELLEASESYTGTTPLVVDHEIRMSDSPSRHAVRAQSFWNGYKLFTLVWPQ